MGVKVIGIDNAIKELQQAFERHNQEIITRLSYIGQKVVDGIKDGSFSNWNDNTGNLRSSIGYCVTENGKVVERGGFGVVREGAAGSGIGINFLNNLVGMFPTGFALIVVAGMEYASYVEGIQNKTVLARGEIEARRLIEEMVVKLNHTK